MAKLTVKTALNEIYLVGEFCDWNLSEAKLVKKRKNAKNIIVNPMPEGEYKILTEPSWNGEEKNADGSTMANRVFDGTADETVELA